MTGGAGVITGEFTADSAIRLAAEINARSLPLSLTAEDFSVISPAQGSQMLTTLCRSAGLGLILLAVLMLALYRLPGAVGLAALVIQLELTLAAFTGLVPLVQPVQLTVSGLFGILLTMGFGVNTSVNTAEHIKAELLGGRNLDYAVNHGFKRTYSTLFDGHTTLVFLLILLLTAVSGFVTDLTWADPCPDPGWSAPGTADCGCPVAALLLICCAGWHRRKLYFLQLDRPFHDAVPDQISGPA